MQARKVDDNRFVIPKTDVYFEGYEVRKLKPFKSPREIRSFLKKLSRKANKLGFKTEELEVDKTLGVNQHWGLFPDVSYKFSGDLRLERKIKTVIDDRDGHGKSRKQTVHDYWWISVLDNGEIDSCYGKRGKIPRFEKGRRKFMEGISRSLFYLVKSQPEGGFTMKGYNDQPKPCLDPKCNGMVLPTYNANVGKCNECCQDFGWNGYMKGQ